MVGSEDAQGITLWVNASEGLRLAAINDAKGIREQRRERRIRSSFAVHGIEVTFVD